MEQILNQASISNLENHYFKEAYLI